jgi:hypothetical protein
MKMTLVQWCVQGSISGSMERSTPGGFERGDHMFQSLTGRREMAQPRDKGKIEVARD